MQLIQRTPYVVLAIPGFTHSPTALAPLAKAVMAKHPHCRFILFDLPAIPGKLFGQTSLEDYAEAVIAKILEVKSARGLYVNEILGHSMGGLVALLAYQSLQETKKHALSQVTILSSSSIPGIPWSIADSGAADALGDQYTIPNDPKLGTHCKVPDDQWTPLWFTTSNGTPAKGTPSLKEVAVLNVAASGLMDDQLSRHRPATITPIQPGLFQTETRLQQIVFGDDPYARFDEQKTMFDHLTGGAKNQHAFRLVSPPESIHDLIVTQPEEVALYLDGYGDYSYESVSI